MPTDVAALVIDTDWRNMDSNERGMYFSLLVSQWAARGTGLLDDENLLWREAACTTPLDSTEWEHFRDVYLWRLFPVGKKGRRRHEGYHEAWIRAILAQRGRSIGGKRGAQTRKEQRLDK